MKKKLAILTIVFATIVSLVLLRNFTRLGLFIDTPIVFLVEGDPAVFSDFWHLHLPLTYPEYFPEEYEALQAKYGDYWKENNRRFEEGLEPLPFPED